MKRDVVAAALGFSFILAVGASVAPAQAQSARPAYIGVWMPSSVACGPSPETTDEFVKFTTRGMEGPESLCKFDRVTGGPSRWSASVTCNVEGTTSRGRIEFQVDGQTMTLKRGGPKNRPARYTRCS